MAASARPLLPATKVLSQDDAYDLLPGACFKSGEGMPDINNLHAVLLRGALDEGRLRTAVDALQARHPRMRARYAEDAGCQHNFLLESTERIPLHVREGAFETANLDLEHELRRHIDFAAGPFCYVTYVRHAAGTGLLVFGNSHAVADGRGCEIALAHLLRLYDGQRVPYGEHVKSVELLRHEQREKQGFKGSMDPVKLESWRRLQREHPDLQTRTSSLCRTFIDPQHPDFRAEFEGVAIELARLTSEQQRALLGRCREAGATVGGAVAAAVRVALVRRLAERGRGAEFVTLGMDMNHRQLMDPKLGDEVGQLMYVVAVHLPVAGAFWDTARSVTRFLKDVHKQDVGPEAEQAQLGPLSRRRLRLLRKMTSANQIHALGRLEHANVSSLGLLRKYTKYSDFEVLENITAGHILGTKFNVCTSGASGVLTISAIVSKSIIPQPRELARALAEDVRSLLADPPPCGGESSEALAEGVNLMKPLIEQNRQRSESGRAIDGTIFAGDASGAAVTARTHLRLIAGVLLSLLITGPLSGMQYIIPALQTTGAFSAACEVGQTQCLAQANYLQSLYLMGGVVSVSTTLFLGYAYDAMGARDSSRLGSLATGFSMTLAALAFQLDARRWPVSQGLTLLLSFGIADMGSLLTSMGLNGWMWHYPRQQTFIMGLSNFTFQASGPVLAWLINWAVARGWSASLCFFLAGMVAMVAGYLMMWTLPSRAEYFGEAARVLGLSPSMVNMTSMLGWDHMVQHIEEAFCVIRLYKVQNVLFIMANLLALTSFYYWSSTISTGLPILFGPEAAAGLQAFAARAQACTSAANIAIGILTDSWGFLPVFLGQAAVLVTNSVLIWLPSAEHAFIVSSFLFFGMYQTLGMKWPVLFGTAEVYGIFAGTLIFCNGPFMFVLFSLLAAVQPEDAAHYIIPNGVTAALAAVASVVCGLALGSRKFGVPLRPPENRFGRVALS